MAHALSAAIAMTTMCTTSEKTETHEVFLVAAHQSQVKIIIRHFWNMTKTHTIKQS